MVDTGRNMIFTHLQERAYNMAMVDQPYKRITHDSNSFQLVLGQPLVLELRVHSRDHRIEIAGIEPKSQDYVDLGSKD